MGNDRKHGFDFSDYVALGTSLLLAFAVWLVHNLSLTYSDLIQCPIGVVCELDGYDNKSVNTTEIAARCEMRGYSLAAFKWGGHKSPCYIEMDRADLHCIMPEIFYVTSSEMTKHFHEIFGEDAKLEYFVTDTLFFRFPAMSYKKIPVSVLSSLAYKPQYMPKGELKVSPDSVLVYGSDADLEDVNQISTKLIREVNIDKDLYGTVVIDNPAGLRLSAGTVSYSLPVTRYVEEMLELPVQVINAPVDLAFHIIPEKAKVRVRSIFPGAADLDDVEIVVDYYDFLSSVNGRCMGRVTNLPATVLQAETEPCVFDCLAGIQ